MTTFGWSGPTSRGTYNYLYNEDDDGYSRAVGIASVYAQGAHYRVITAHFFDALIPQTAYILRKKFATAEAAKRAVERKIPGLIAVLKISGGIEI